MKYIGARIDRISYHLNRVQNERDCKKRLLFLPPGEAQTLDRLKLALKCKQKAFVAHPNVQQLLATIWYEGLPGWRRMNVFHQTIELCRLGLMFPIYCIAYMICPGSDRGVFMRNPFVKFIAHSGSYMCFLLLLAAASQRVRVCA